MSELKEQVTPRRPDTDDDTLRYTRNIRLDIVSKLTEDGIPKDNKDQQILLQTLDGMDRCALTNKKIGASEQTAEADRIVALAIAQLNNQFGSNNPFERPINGGVQGNVPLLDGSRMPVIDLVPGETDVGLSTLTYDTFIDTVEGKS